jgi:hypothetical protein
MVYNSTRKQWYKHALLSYGKVRVAAATSGNQGFSPTVNTSDDTAVVFSPSLRDFACMGHRDPQQALNRLDNTE